MVWFKNYLLIGARRVKLLLLLREGGFMRYGGERVSSWFGRFIMNYVLLCARWYVLECFSLLVLFLWVLYFKICPFLWL